MGIPCYYDDDEEEEDLLQNLNDITKNAVVLHQRVEVEVCHSHENFEKLDAKSCIVSVSWRCFIALTED
jgi:hypothetical protein